MDVQGLTIQFGDNLDPVSREDIEAQLDAEFDVSATIDIVEDLDDGPIGDRSLPDGEPYTLEDYSFLGGHVAHIWPDDEYAILRKGGALGSIDEVVDLLAGGGLSDEEF